MKRDDSGRQWRHLVKEAALACAIVAAGTSDAAEVTPQDSVDPLALYGTRHEFSVLRNDIPVGKHVVSFQKAGEGIRVGSVFDVKINFLGLELYRFDYQSKAIWIEGELKSIDINIDDDGEKSKIRAERFPAAFMVNGEAHPVGESREIFPTNHWNPAVLNQSRLFNTLTGSMNTVTIANAGEETVAVRSGAVRANRYVYRGELELESWYDRAGRWVKMRFRAKDNSDMVYFCETCPVEEGSVE